MTTIVTGTIMQDLVHVRAQHIVAVELVEIADLVDGVRLMLPRGPRVTVPCRG
jgi:hypothetical protein